MEKLNTFEILRQVDHRPWKLPQGKWQFYQEWKQAIFLHWKVSREELEKFVPANLELDLFEGEAWMSIVAFTMENVRPRYFPPVPGISFFDELNFRTYARKDGKGGVYFLSMEAGSRLAASVARALSALPYRYAGINRGKQHFTSGNPQSGERFLIRYQAGEKLREKSALEVWLTERYALFQPAGKGVQSVEIHHREWPLYHLDINELEVQYPQFEKLIPGPPHLAHYSPGVQAVSWAKQW